MNHEDHYDVIVVGGSLVGSAAAMFLAQQGLSVCVLEKRMKVSPHPRARGIHTRTMELYRAAGIEARIRQAGEADFTFVTGDTLAGPHHPVAQPDTDTMSRLSPTTPYSCDQSRVEPILRRRAEDWGARVWTGSTAMQVEQDADGVTVEVATDASPEPHSTAPQHLRARFLVAADGSNSGLRHRLGVGRRGRDIPGTGLSALFDADLGPALRGRRVSALVAARHGAILFPRSPARDYHWLGLIPDPELEGLQGDALAAAATSAIRSVVGDHALTVSLRDVVSWRTGAYVAERYRCGRIFFVGDAAHLMPPYGGFGGNTGISDAHNLAWKLAAVCAGEADDTLLDTYERERRPVATFTIEHVMNRGFGPRASQPTTTHDQLQPSDVSLGYCYATDDSDPDSGPVRDPMDAAGVPGMRMPHVQLRGAAYSTLDLLDARAFTFLTSEGSVFARRIESAKLTGVRTRVIPRQDIADTTAWQRVFGDPAGAGLLVRPDGIVTWRAVDTPRNPHAAITSARARCLKPIERSTEE